MWFLMRKKNWEWGQADAEIREVPLVCEEEEEIPNANEEENQNANEVVEESPQTMNDENVPSPNHGSERGEVRTVRERRAPGWMADYDTGKGGEEEENLSAILLMMTMTESDPIRFDEAVKNRVWREAMEREIESIEKNSTWELVTLPEGFAPIGVKWVYKTKLTRMVKLLNTKRG